MHCMLLHLHTGYNKKRGNNNTKGRGIGNFLINASTRKEASFRNREEDVPFIRNFLEKDEGEREDGYRQKKRRTKKIFAY